MTPGPQGDILVAFLSIFLEGAPYILLGTLISGFIAAYLPAGAMESILPRRVGPAILLSGLLGAVFPVCECAVVPVIRRLVQKGLPVGCAITYMLAAPIINPIVVISTLSAFQGQDAGYMTISRLLMAFLVAIVIGFVVSRLPVGAVLRDRVLRTIPDPASAKAKSEDKEQAPSRVQGPDADEKLVYAMRMSLRDFCDTSMYFIIGVLITAVFNTQFDQALLKPVASNEALAVPAMMGLAFVLSLCSTSDAFIAATMAAFSQASKLAFLVFGPMMDIKLVFMYLAVFQKRFVLGLVLGVFVLVSLLSAAWSVAG